MNIRDYLIPTKQNNYTAKLLKHNGMIFLTVFVLVSNFFIAKLPQSQTIAQVDLNSIVYAHNRERAKLNLPPLSLSAKLVDSATLKANAMLESDCWDHYCPVPPGVSPWKWFKDVEYKYEAAGENLAEGFNDNETVIKAWMNSPTHRENMLKEKFEEVGIGFASGQYQGKNDNTIVVVHFAKPERGESIRNFATTKEDSELEQIKIFRPAGGAILREEDFMILGQVDVLGDSLEISLNNEQSIVAKIRDNGYFEVDKEDGLNIISGENTMVVNVLYDSEVIATRYLNFFIDNELPSISIADLRVSDVVDNSSERIVVIELPYFDDISSSWAKIHQEKYSSTYNTDGIFFEIPQIDLINSDEIVFTVQDIAGNEQSYTIDSQSILNLAGRIAGDMEEIDLMVTQAPNTMLGTFVTSAFTYTLPSLSLNQSINLLFLLFIMVLIVIDYLVLKKNGLHELVISGKHHLKLSILFMVGFVIILSTGLGTILTGTAV